MSSKEELKYYLSLEEGENRTITADFINCLENVYKDLEILEILKEHLYVASGLVELKITSQEYANIHRVKYHNGIPIVNQEAINKINKWFYRRDK